MKKPLTCLAVAGLAAPAALAQWEEDWQVWETGTELGTTVVAATDAVEGMLFRAWAGASVDRVLDNGVEIGAAGRFEVQKDHPSRAGFTGVPAGFGGSAVVPSGALTGLAVGTPEEDTGMRARMEKLYLYAESGYGEVRIGKDEGVAVRFREGAPSVFDAAATGAASLDPYGVDIVSVRHDLTGPSLKVSYATPRLIGIRAGISFTPSADAEGLDRDVGRTGPGTPPLQIDNAIEAALNVSRRLPESGVRLRAGLAISTAETGTAPYAAGTYDRLNSWSIGGSAAFDTVAFGLSYLSSDNGIDGSGSYQAWSAGLTKQAGRYTFGAEYGAAEDELTGLEGDTWSVGVGRDLGEFSRIALAYREHSLEFSRPGARPPFARSVSPEGVVIEITLFRGN